MRWSDMLTLGIVGARTDCKADNHRNQLIQRTATSCQPAQKWVVRFLTLGPNCTCNMGYETTDRSLEIIEISRTKNPKAVRYKIIRTGALSGLTSKILLAIKAWITPPACAAVQRNEKPCSLSPMLMKITLKEYKHQTLTTWNLSVR